MGNNSYNKCAHRRHLPILTGYAYGEKIHHTRATVDEDHPQAHTSS